LPKFAINENVSKLKNLDIFYEYLIFENVMGSEFLLWYEKWVNVEKAPTEILLIRSFTRTYFFIVYHFWQHYQVLQQQLNVHFQH
jgi:hypothetical protein